MLFNLFHVITIVLMPGVAIGLPTELQAVLCKDTPIVDLAALTPVVATARSVAVYRDYSTTNCGGASFIADYELAPNLCYQLLYSGAHLRYTTCGQVYMYAANDCTGAPILLTEEAVCYNVGSIYSIQLLGC